MARRPNTEGVVAEDDDVTGGSGEAKARCSACKRCKSGGFRIRSFLTQAMDPEIKV